MKSICAPSPLLLRRHMYIATQHGRSFPDGQRIAADLDAAQPLEKGHAEERAAQAAGSDGHRDTTQGECQSWQTFPPPRLRSE